MTDHAAAAQGLAAGVGGAILALLGVDAQLLTAALIACGLGAMFTPPVSRGKAIALFFAAVSATAISASVLGPMLGSWWPWASASAWAKIVALGVGFWLHPALQAGANAVPRLVDAAVGRLESAKSDGDAK